MRHMITCKLKIKGNGFCACTYRQTLRRRTSLHRQFEHTDRAVRTSGVEYQSSQQHLQRNGKLENKKQDTLGSTQSSLYRRTQQGSCSTQRG